MSKHTHTHTERHTNYGRVTPLLDAIILPHTIHPNEEDYDNHELTEPEFPALA